MSKLTHLNADGEARMVDVSDKKETKRVAMAQAEISGKTDVIKALLEGTKKGDALATARIAAIMAAKKTHELIPLCHPLALSGIDVSIEQVDETRLRIEVAVKTTGQTGVEMEALTACSVGALTLYDMGKALDKGMVISQVKLLAKSGGKSGDYRRAD